MGIPDSKTFSILGQSFDHHKIMEEEVGVERETLDYPNIITGTPEKTETERLWVTQTGSPKSPMVTLLTPPPPKTKGVRVTQ